MAENQLTWGGETTADERMWALGAHLCAFVFPVLAALIVYFIKKDESKFVAYHAAQAMAFQLIAWIIGGATCGVGLILLVIPIWIAMKAHKGEWEGYPLIAGIGR